jgi:hypothetical protein
MPTQGTELPAAEVTAPNSVDTLLAALGGKIGTKKETNVGSKLKSGGKVPGKQRVNPGPVNNYANDTVNAKLTPKEIVLPVSVTEGPDPVNDAAKFVAAIMAKKRAGGK